MELTKLTVNVKTTVDRETAARCLKVVEWFLNDHPEIDLIADSEKDNPSSDQPSKRITLFFKRTENKEAEGSNGE